MRIAGCGASAAQRPSLETKVRRPRSAKWLPQVGCRVQVAGGEVQERGLRGRWSRARVGCRVTGFAVADWPAKSCGLTSHTSDARSLESRRVSDPGLPPEGCPHLTTDVCIGRCGETSGSSATIPGGGIGRPTADPDQAPTLVAGALALHHQRPGTLSGPAAATSRTWVWPLVSRLGRCAALAPQPAVPARPLRGARTSTSGARGFESSAAARCSHLNQRRSQVGAEDDQGSLDRRSAPNALGYPRIGQE